MQLTTLGFVSLVAALLSGLVSIALPLLGASKSARGTESIVGYGYLATYAVLGFVTLAVGVLVTAFLTQNFHFEYVALNHTTDVSAFAVIYRISGLWAGREGSLLFWEWMLAIFAAWTAWRRMSIKDRLSNVALSIINVVQVFFLSALFITTNYPFRETAAQYIGPNGQLLINAAMNPLLQTWAMVIHPPTLFIGYAGLTVPFAFALAALFVNEPDSKWVKIVDRVSVFSWLMLGIGIGLGALWAYQELAFGGFWAWDPVENASLLPWLAGVGLLHSFTVYRRKGAFKAWSIVMATVTFILVILGTFITRSGIVKSVHAFENDPASFVLFLSIMLLAGVVGLGMLWYRRDSFASSSDFESLLSKDASYYFNNVLMLVASVLVAYWTVAPSLPAWLPGAGQTYAAGAFNAIARPVGILRAEQEDRGMWPAAAAAVIGVGLLAIWWTQLRPVLMADAGGLFGQLIAVVGLLVAALAIALPLYLFFDGTRKRMASSGENPFVALGNILTKARTTSGGYITHFGMGVILVGLIGSTMFVQEFQVTVPQTSGTSVAAGTYSFTFKGMRSFQVANGDYAREATLLVTQGASQVAIIKPMQLLPLTVLRDAQQQGTWVKSQPLPYESGRREVDIIVGPLRDVFAVFNGVETPGDPKSPLALDVKINPLIDYVWIGFGLVIVGTALALWPKRRAAAA